MKQCDNTYIERLEADLGAGFLVAYTDGSFDETTNRYAYGCVLFDLDGTEVHLSGVGCDPDFATSRNIAGEVFGVLSALEHAKKHNRKMINIYHDYSGLMHWAKNEWKTKTKISQFYKAELHKYADIEIVFSKVKGHSGVKYNDLADHLASAALQKN